MIFATLRIKYLWTRYEPDQYLCVPQGAAQPGARQPLHLGHAEVVPQVEVQSGRRVRELLRLPPRPPRPHLSAHCALAPGQVVTCSLVIHGEGVLFGITIEIKQKQVGLTLESRSVFTLILLEKEKEP